MHSNGFEKRAAVKLALVVSLLISGCAGRLPLVGLDRDGQPVLARVSGRAYSEKFGEALASIEKSVAPALDKTCRESDDTQWKLRTLLVGISVSAQAGIGPFKVGIKPGIDVAFGNGENPPLP